MLCSVMMGLWAATAENPAQDIRALEEEVARGELQNLELYLRDPDDKHRRLRSISLLQDNRVLGYGAWFVSKLQFKNDLHGISMDVRQQNIYADIVQRIVGHSSGAVPMSYIADLKTMMIAVRKGYERFVLYGRPNVAASKIHIIYENNENRHCVLSRIMPCLFVSGASQGKPADDVDVFAVQFARNSKGGIIELLRQYSLNMPSHKRLETDQDLFCQLFFGAEHASASGFARQNWLRDFVDFCRRKAVDIKAIKGIVIDIVSYLDPCDYCSVMINKELHEKIIHNKIRDELRVMELPVAPDFKLCFHFTTFQGSGNRPAAIDPRGVGDDGSTFYVSCYNFSR